MCVQEHISKKPHFDLRLQHNGVAMSWVLYKPFPLEAGKRRRAFCRGAHPLSFLQEGEGRKNVVTGTCKIIVFTKDQVLFSTNGKTIDGIKVHGTWKLTNQWHGVWVLQNNAKKETKK